MSSQKIRDFVTIVMDLLYLLFVNHARLGASTHWDFFEIGVHMCGQRKYMYTIHTRPCVILNNRGCIKGGPP